MRETGRLVGLGEVLEGVFEVGEGGSGGFEIRLERGVGGFGGDGRFDGNEVADLVIHFGGVVAVENAVEAGGFEGGVEFGDEEDVGFGGGGGSEVDAEGLGEVGGGGGGEVGEEGGERGAGGAEGGRADGAVVSSDGFDEFIRTDVEAAEFGGGGGFRGGGSADGGDEDDEKDNNAEKSAKDDFHFFVEEAGGDGGLFDAGGDLV